MSFIHDEGFLCLEVLVIVLSAITWSEDEGESFCTSSDFSTGTESVLLKNVMHSSFCHPPAGKYSVPSFQSLSVAWCFFAHLS